MRSHTLGIIAAGMLLGALLVGGVGMTLASGHAGWAPWSGTPGSMMGQNGHSPMMGSNGYGPMMNGQYGATVQATAVVGATQVQIVGDAFTPAHIQVPVGTKVTWSNTDSDPHTVTFMPMYRMSGSGTIQQGESYSYTFTASGVYTYYCAVHPYMKGTVTVNA